MYEQVEKPKENKIKAVADSVVQKKSDMKQGFGFVDNRPKVQSQNFLQSIINRKRTDVVQMNGDKVDEKYTATYNLFVKNPLIHFSDVKAAQGKLFHDSLNDLSKLSMGRSLMNTISSNIEIKNAKLIITPGEDWHVEGQRNKRGFYIVKLIYAKKLPPEVSGVNGEQIGNTYTVALGHELAHVQDHVLRKGEVSKNMKKKYAEEMSKNDPKNDLWSNEKEYSAIEGTENPLREELGLPKRKYHGSVLDYEIKMKTMAIGKKSKRINNGIRKHIDENKEQVKENNVKNIAFIINVLFFETKQVRDAETDNIRKLYDFEKQNMNTLLTDEYTNEELLQYKANKGPNDYHVITEEIAEDY